MSRHPAGEPEFVPAGNSCWVAAARLIALSASPGGSAQCRLVLQRDDGVWSDVEAAAASGEAGPLRGTGGQLPGAVHFGPAGITGGVMQIPLTIAVAEGAPLGRYKGALAVHCSGRVEPLGMLLEVRADH